MQYVVIVFLVALLFPAIFATQACKENCLSASCPECFCGTASSNQDIKAICSQYEWDQAECACALTHASAGNANAVSVAADGSASVGLFMINSALWSSCSNGAAPCSAADNLQCAIKLYKEGGNSFALFSSNDACNVEVTTKKPTTTTHHAAATHATHGGNNNNNHASHSTSGSTYSGGFMQSPVKGGGKGGVPQAQAKKFDF